MDAQIEEHCQIGSKDNAEQRVSSILHEWIICLLLTTKKKQRLDDYE